MKKKNADYEKLIDDALELINTPTEIAEDEKQTAKVKRAYTRAKLETIMEKKRLQTELSDDYEYLLE